MDSKKRLAIYLVFVLGISIFLYGFVNLINSSSVNGKAIAPGSTYSCVDSDGGLSFFSSGDITVTSNSGTSKGMDFCSGDNLTEYYCGGDNHSQSTNYICPLGCENGACVSCYDTSINDTNLLVKDAEEYCSSTGNGVYESFCESNTSIGYALEACPSGTKCYEGACVSCYDSDNGKNYTFQGFIWNASYNFNMGFSDECLDSNVLNEFYCNGNNLMNETKNCSIEFGSGYDCEEGACVCVPDWELLDCTSEDIGSWHDSNNCGDVHELTGCDKDNNGVMWSSGVSFFDQEDISINGNDFDNSETYTGVKSVDLNDGHNDIQFNWDFSNPLNLQEVNVVSAESTFDWNYILISGLNVENKTIVIDRFNDSDSVCIIDEENVSSEDFSGYCNATNEVLVSCPGVDNVSNPHYHCDLSNNNTRFKVWPLAHSAVAEWSTGEGISSCSSEWACGNWSNCSCDNCEDGIQYKTCHDLNGCSEDYVENQSCGQCISDWSCPNWESIDCINGQKIRTCIDLNSCGTETNKPSEFISCTDEKKGSFLPLILIILGGIILVSLIIYLFMHKRENEDSNLSQTYSSQPPVTPQTNVYTPWPVR